MHYRNLRPFGLLLGCLLSLFAPLCHAADAAPGSPRVGEFPPPLTGSSHLGKPVDLEQRRGKVVVMTFWASWCGPCMRELPMLAHLQKVVGKDALEVVAVNWGEPRAEVLTFARRNSKYDLEYLLDPRGNNAERYGIKAVPHMFVLGHDGRIAAIHRGYSEASLPAILNNVLDLLPDEVKARPANATAK